MKTLFVISLALMTLAGCGQSSNRDGFHYSFSVSAIKNSNLSKADAAEALAKGAEQLFGAKAFDQADGVALEALKIDPTNFRAGFLHAALDPLRKQKGILIRLQPLAAKSQYLQAYLDDETKASKANPEAHFNWYYLDGKPDIATEQDFQKLVDGQIQALERFRLFLHAHKDQEITIAATPVLLSDASGRYASRCKINQVGDSYELYCPPAVERRQVSFNRADFEEMELGTAFYELYMTIVNAYDYSGFADVLHSFTKITNLDRQALFDKLMAKPEFGRMRLPLSLMQSRSLGLIITGAMDWASEHPELTCPAGQDSPNNRPGFFYFKGFCVAGITPYLPTLDRISHTHGSVRVDLPLDNKTESYDINLFAPYEKPIASLKELGPLKYNECGNLTSMRDGTFAGLFPNDGYLKILKLDSACK